MILSTDVEASVALRDELLEVLRDRPAALLSSWLWFLSTSARQYYTQIGVAEDDSARALQCANELSQILSGQLRSVLSGREAYPFEALLDTLTERAAGVCSGDLRWSAEQALADVNATEVPG